MVYNSIPSQNHPVADKVLGQKTNLEVYSDGGALLPSINTFNAPVGVSCFENKILVSDYVNGRILVREID